MSASFYELMRYAKTGIDSPGMTHYDKMRALAAFGTNYPETTITGVPPVSFKSDGSALTAWSIAGNMVQDGTPTPDAPIYPQECGDLVGIGEHAGQYAIPITPAGQTQTIYLSDPLRKIGDYADAVSSDGTVTRQITNMVLTGTETTWRITGSGRISVRIASENTIPENASCVCSHFIGTNKTIFANIGDGECSAQMLVSDRYREIGFYSITYSTLDAFKQFIAYKYAAGTPVTVWYVLATHTTEQITLPTITPAKGSNTLTIGTVLPPSLVSITGHIKAG